MNGSETSQEAGAGSGRKSDGRRSLTWTLAVAALMFLALWGWTEMRLSAAREAGRSLEAEKGTLEGEVRRSALRDRLHERRSGVALPELTKVVLAPVNGSESMRGRVYVDHSSGRVFGFFSGLEPAPGGMTYQLWFLAEGSPPESIGRVAFDEDGDAVVTSARFPPESATGQFRLTLEPAGGALTPTGRDVLRGRLEAAESGDSESSSAEPN